MQKYTIIQGKIAKNEKNEHALWALAITATTTILGFCISTKNPGFCMLIAIILTSIMACMAILKRKIISDTSYIIVFLEPYLENVKYETRKFMLPSKFPTIFILSFVKYVPLVIFAFVFGILFCNYQTDSFNIIVTSVLMLAAYVICIYIMCLETNKKEWIKKWEKIKEKEDKVCGKH